MQITFSLTINHKMFCLGCKHCTVVFLRGDCATLGPVWSKKQTKNNKQKSLKLVRGYLNAQVMLFCFSHPSAAKDLDEKIKGIMFANMYDYLSMYYKMDGYKFQ